jgi:multidrug resistance efflux pump
MRRKVLLAAAIVVLLSAAAAALLRTRNRPPAAAIQPPPAPAAAPIPPPATREISLTGQVQAANVVNVPAPVDGTIEEWMADTGDVVIEGKVLARIKNPKLAAAEAAAQSEAERARNRITELESELIAAQLEVSRSQADQARVKTEVDRAEKEYRKQQLMFRQGITARLVYEKSEQDYNAFKAESEKLAEAAKNAANRVSSLSDEAQGARKDLDRQKAAVDEAHAESGAGEVRSPAAGIVVARCCQIGESVMAVSTSMFQIAGDLTMLQVAAPADSAAIQRIRPGQNASIEIMGISTLLSGQVREVQPEQVIIEFTSPSQPVRPGMTARVTIKLS